MKKYGGEKEKKKKTYNKLVMLSFCICERIYKSKGSEKAKEEEAIALTVHTIAVSSHCSSL